MNKLYYKILVTILNVLYHSFIRYNNKVYKLQSRGKEEKATKLVMKATKTVVTMCLINKEIKSFVDGVNEKIKNESEITRSECKAYMYIASVSETIYLRTEQARSFCLCLRDEFFKGE